jgi:hypothetical protein
MLPATIRAYTRVLCYCVTGKSSMAKPFAREWHKLLPRTVGVFSLTSGRWAARPGTASADLEHQLAPQVARFAHPVGLGCVGECVAGNVRRPYCARLQQFQHAFQMLAVTGHARA